MYSSKKKHTIISNSLFSLLCYCNWQTRWRFRTVRGMSAGSVGSGPINSLWDKRTGLNTIEGRLAPSQKWEQAAESFITIMWQGEESGRHTQPLVVQWPAADTMQTPCTHSSLSHKLCFSSLKNVIKETPQHSSSLFMICLIFSLLWTMFSTLSVSRSSQPLPRESACVQCAAVNTRLTKQPVISNCRLRDRGWLSGVS